MPLSLVAPHRFDATYREELTLTCGAKLIVRSIRPDDKGRLEQHFAHLSMESRYRRFLGAKNALSAKELEFLTNPDGKGHFALVALDAGDPERMIGVARFICDPAQPDHAEPAIAVVDTMQNKGLGSRLLRLLGAAAVERGVTHFHFSILAENSSMRTLVHQLVPGAELTRTMSTLDFEAALGQAKAVP